MPTCVSIESLIVTLSLYYAAVHAVTESRTAGLTQLSEDDTMTGFSRVLLTRGGKVIKQTILLYAPTIRCTIRLPVMAVHTIIYRKIIENSGVGPTTCAGKCD